MVLELSSLTFSIVAYAVLAWVISLAVYVIVVTFREIDDLLPG